MNKASLFRLEPGTILDKKYRIVNTIGSGGMGFVYRATNIVLKREVAIKTLQVHKDGDDAALRRFHQEAQIAASIGHDNICEVIDFGTHHPQDGDFDVYYLVMPLLTGQSLGQWFDSWVKPSPPLFVDIIAQTLLGLHAAHQKKIVHRDLKPDNIFITHIGDRDNFVKILDFGISKYLESDIALNLTQTGIAMGTPLYMCPEQAKGLKYIDHTADIYAVGVVLYEGFVGALPYGGENFNDVLLKIATKPYVEPRRANPNVPKEIEGVIMKAMSRLPKDRYLTALQMRRALLRAAAMANIDERKSFVYPTSSMPPRPLGASVNIVATAVRDETTSRKLIETKLKAMQGIPTEAISVAPPSKFSGLKLLVGIIIISLIIASIGVGYILTNQREQTESTNIVPVAPASPGAAESLQVVPVTEVETLDETDLPDEPALTMPVEDAKQGARSGKVPKSRVKGGKAAGGRPHRNDTQATEEKPAAPPPLSGRSKKGERNRYIERDADSIFD